MIKLFWNTHNQITPTSQNPNKEDTFDYKWGVYHKNNSDKWIHHILSKINFKTIKSEKDIENNDILIIIDSSIEKKIELYVRLQLICSKVFLFHLGDEANSYELSSIYNNCDFVWRSFCINKYFNNDKISCLPIGYKSGVILKNFEKDRKYKWAFLGTPHKSSRHDLLFQLSDIKPSYCHKTKNFNENIIEASEMSDILSSTVFIPCPNGFVHPETYRLYEALECQCIPIVENTYKYYDRLFPENPFIKINKWMEAKKILNTWSKNQIEEKQEECKVWWTKSKINIQNSISEKINL